MLEPIKDWVVKSKVPCVKVTVVHRVVPASVVVIPLVLMVKAPIVVFV